MLKYVSVDICTIRNTKAMITWRCALNSSAKCLATMKTALDLTNPREIKSHNQPSNEEKILVNECVNEMKIRAPASLDKPNQVR